MSCLRFYVLANTVCKVMNVWFTIKFIHTHTQTHTHTHTHTHTPIIIIIITHTHTHTLSLSLSQTHTNKHHHHHHQHHHYHHELHHLQFLINQMEKPQTFVDTPQRSKRAKEGCFTLWAATPWCCPSTYRWREACLSTLTPTLLPWGRLRSFCPTLVSLCNTSMVAHHTHSCGWFTLMCSMISYWLKGWWIR